jgi:hypothetical protein
MVGFELEANSTLVIDWNQQDPELIFQVFRHETSTRPKSIRFNEATEQHA